MYYFQTNKYGEQYLNNPIDNKYFDTKQEAILYRKNKKLSSSYFIIKQIDMLKFNEDNNEFCKSLNSFDFKIYLTKNFYYNIKVFENKKSMWLYYSGKEKENFSGIHIPYAQVYDSGIDFKEFRYKKNKYKSCVGEILLSKENIGGSVVSHEVSHAVINFMLNFKNIDILSHMDNEEDFCCMMGNTVSGIYNVLYQYKII